VGAGAKNPRRRALDGRGTLASLPAELNPPGGVAGGLPAALRRPAL